MNYFHYTKLLSILNTLWFQGGRYTEVLLFSVFLHEGRAFFLDLSHNLKLSESPVIRHISLLSTSFC